MEIEIHQQPITFQLQGLTSTVNDNCYGKVGFELMNTLWKIVKEEKLATTGINHWVYPQTASMFVGVELLASSPSSDKLTLLQFELSRYGKHVHLGPYQNLPQKWQALKTELASRGERLAAYSLEVYGHPCDDESKLETTIYIGLEPNATRGAIAACRV